MNPSRYAHRIAALHRHLGIPADYARRRGLALQPETRHLVDAGPDRFDRPQRMTRRTLAAWRGLQSAAGETGVKLELVSAFRSVSQQAGIIRRKLEQGQDLQQVLAVSAAPGYSEHHSGRALDLHTPGVAVLSEDFAATAAYRWLCKNAQEFGFMLSFPTDNPHGIAFEPWHWCYRPASSASSRASRSGVPTSSQHPR